MDKRRVTWLLTLLVGCGASSGGPPSALEPRNELMPEHEAELGSEEEPATPTLYAWLRPGWSNGNMSVVGSEDGSRLYLNGTVRVAVHENGTVELANSFGDLPNSTPLVFAHRLEAGWLFEYDGTFAFADSYMGSLVHFPEISGGVVMQRDVSAFVRSSDRRIFEIAGPELKEAPFPFAVAILQDRERTIAILPTTLLSRPHGTEDWRGVTIPGPVWSTCESDEGRLTLRIAEDAYRIDDDQLLPARCQEPSGEALIARLSAPPTPEQREDRERQREQTRLDTEAARRTARSLGHVPMTLDGTALLSAETGLAIEPWGAEAIEIPNSDDCRWDARLAEPSRFRMSCAGGDLIVVVDPDDASAPPQLIEVPAEIELVHIVDHDRWIVADSAGSRAWFTRSTDASVPLPTLPGEGELTFGSDLAVYQSSLRAGPRITRVARWGAAEWSEPIPFSPEATDLTILADGSVCVLIPSSGRDVPSDTVARLEMWRNGVSRRVSVPSDVTLVGWMSDGSIVAAGASDGAFWRSGDLGENWSQVALDPRASSSFSVSATPSPGEVISNRSSLSGFTCPWMRCRLNGNVMIAPSPAFGLRGPVIVRSAPPVPPGRARSELTLGGAVESTSTQLGSYIGHDKDGVYEARVDLRASDGDVKVVRHVRSAALLLRQHPDGRQELLHARVNERPRRVLVIPEDARASRTLLLADGSGAFLAVRPGVAVRGFAWDANGAVSGERGFAATGHVEPVFMDSRFHAYVGQDGPTPYGVLVPIQSDDDPVPFTANVGGYCAGPRSADVWAHELATPQSWAVGRWPTVSSSALVERSGENWCIRRSITSQYEVAADDEGRLRSLITTRAPISIFNIAVRGGDLAAPARAFLESDSRNIAIGCHNAPPVRARYTLRLEDGEVDLSDGPHPKRCVASWMVRLFSFLSRSGDVRSEGVLRFTVTFDHAEPGEYVTASGDAPR